MNEKDKRIVLWAPKGDELGDLKTSLERQGFVVRLLEFEEQVREVLQRNEADLMMARLRRGFEFPLNLLPWIEKLTFPPPVLIVTDAQNICLYLQAMKCGAFDCVVLPLYEHELKCIVAQALEFRHHAVAA